MRDGQGELKREYMIGRELKRETETQAERAKGSERETGGES